MDKRFNKVVTEMDKCSREARDLESSGKFKEATAYREKEYLYAREVKKANAARIAENKRLIGLS